MKTWIIIPVLAFLCSCLQVSHSQCNLDDGKPDKDFPDVESEGIESYQMSVEFTVPGAKQTDYYTEYYDILNRRGRVDAHQAGTSFQYIYRTSSKEAWNIKGRDCQLLNVTAIPEFMKDDQSNWLYAPPNQPERRTHGPSAMFKVALDSWNNKKSGNIKMAYMGEAKESIRGLNAQYWRRCNEDNSYVDYYFSTDDEENAFGMESLKKIPLRVFFGGNKPNKEKEMAEQQYDIISFQPFISLDVKPFELPRGRGCRRGDLADRPDLPDFANKNLFLNAEVIYRVLNFKTGEEPKLWSYYSTLMLALDLTSQHIAYYYTPWNASKTNIDDTAEPDVNSPEYVIFDMKHGYAYKTNSETGQCDIIRESTFTPEYKLPNDGYSISLTDPSILYPNNELSFVTEGTDRGLEVNIFESVTENYVLNRKDGQVVVPKAVITHSYLKDNEILRNSASVKNAPTQVQLRFFGRKDEQTMEILTFNFFGFSTQLRFRRFLFNIMRCFKNDDDYLWLSLGFNADPSVIEKIREDVPSMKSNILNLIEMSSELNPVRIPTIMVDIKDGIYVTMLILGKPPVSLDFLNAEEGKTINSPEVQGVSTFDECATACLETEDNCWGFSMCGAVCYFGTTTTATVTSKAGCKLYRRYNNETFVPSKELTVKNIQREVEAGQVKLVLTTKDGEMIQIDASSVDVTSPGEDDMLFEQMGKELNPRMRVKKAGAKLKNTAGSEVKNFGKLRYDECQRLCLDFKDCETISYCLKNAECVISNKYGDDIKPEEIQEDNMCNLVTRKYADHFDRSPGNVLTVTAAEVLDKSNVEDCARACLTQTKFKCLSFDHCPADDKTSCKLHTVHYPNPKTRESVQSKSTNCGHYFRKYSTEFKKTAEKRYIGSKVPVLTNLTLEECSKNCIEYGKGTCFGFDFCQDVNLFATSCTLLDNDARNLKSTYSPICTNYLRADAPSAPRPYSTNYAAGIGFLCFLVGGLIGAAIVFIIAYVRVNRR